MSARGAAALLGGQCFDGGVGSGGRRAGVRAVLAEAPSLCVLAVTAAGLALAAVGHWRTGAGVLALALLLAAGLRLGLSPRHAGWLVVRSRAFDAGLLLVLGFSVLSLAVVIPRP